MNLKNINEINKHEQQLTKPIKYNNDTIRKTKQLKLMEKGKVTNKT